MGGRVTAVIWVDNECEVGGLGVVGMSPFAANETGFSFKSAFILFCSRSFTRSNVEKMKKKK
jgi:hypothetical protein